MQQHRPVVERTERQEVGESFEQRIDEVDRKCQPEQRKDLLVVCVIMFAPTGDDDIILVGGKEQCRDEVEDQRRDEQPEKQEQRPVRDVAPAVLHPPGDDYCQKHVHHPERVHPVGWRAGAGLEQLAEPAHQPRHREAGDNRGENAYVTKRIHLGFDYGQAYLACRSQAMGRVHFNQKSLRSRHSVFDWEAHAPRVLCQSSSVFGALAEDSRTTCLASCIITGL